ncbi:hypothetical protein IQ260_19610 [Leptolyngbya cf. ectocarpi LEGE 11479]|uniref:Uncharacterized protein n=1 Tax=Leptolyngbya cf. ectocarpi LEGE 11479 TaxID=1828722 RepID=A0A929F7Q5_LEPEC|nr:hypothetical protein [Leptolyngbya ectocarpi]MBE9068855.1 hypothetical protein [Leptolyngbya cf. ectocarpi LEGE 11479]
MKEQFPHTVEMHSPHTSRAVECTGAHYSAKQLADELDTKDSTLRTRWFPWLSKVAPEPLLKTKEGYTELARTLFLEFKDVATAERPAWVTDAKRRYSHEWESVGVIEGELMPESVGGALATLSNQHTSAELAIQQDLSDLEAFIDDINQAEANFSEAELATFRAAGTKRGIARFKIETQTEIDTVNLLRKKRMED